MYYDHYVHWQIIYLEFFSRLRFSIHRWFLVIQLVAIVTGTSLAAFFAGIAALTSAAGVSRTCSTVSALLPAGSQDKYGAN